jgi:hypothetical protein
MDSAGWTWKTVYDLIIGLSYPELIEPKQYMKW